MKKKIILTTIFAVGFLSSALAQQYPSTGALNGQLIVGSAEYPTLASAVSACPATGCAITVLKPQTISTITIDKPVAIFFGGGTQTVTGTITITTDGVSIRGTGINHVTGAGTTFKWNGNATDAMFSIQSASYVDFSDFRIATTTATPLLTGIEIPRRPTGISTYSRFSNLELDGTNGGISYGVRIGNGGSGNTQGDLNIFEKVDIENYSVAAWSIEYSQSKANKFYNCNFISNGFGQYGITTALNSSDGGSFYWHNGSGGGNTVADFYLGSPTDVINIDGGQFEGSPRLYINSVASGAAWPTTIQNIRWAGNNVDADGKFIIYKHRGPLNLINNIIGDGTGGLVPLQANFAASIGGAVWGNAIGNLFVSNLSNPLTGNGNWVSVGNVRRDSSDVNWPLQSQLTSVATIASGPNQIPACVSGLAGASAAVSDGAASLAWGDTLSGSGSTFYAVNCNGTNWTVVGK